jgi:hypothetical protein
MISLRGRDDTNSQDVLFEHALGNLEERRAPQVEGATWG